MGIQHQIQPKFKTKNDEIVARLREDAGAGPPIDPIILIKRKAAELACLMALHQGGDWRMTNDPENGFLVIARHRGPTPT